MKGGPEMFIIVVQDDGVPRICVLCGKAVSAGDIAVPVYADDQDATDMAHFECRMQEVGRMVRQLRKEMMT